MVLSIFWDAVCVRVQVAVHLALCTLIVSVAHCAHFVARCCCLTQRRPHAGLCCTFGHVLWYRMHSVLASQPYVAISGKNVWWVLQRRPQEYDILTRSRLFGYRASDVPS